MVDEELLEPELLADVAAAFGMLSATSRLQIVWLLAAGPHDVGSLATALGQPVAAVSQHLAKLKLAGLVRARREGRHQIYVIDDPGVVETVHAVVAAQRARRRPDAGGAGRARGSA
ncbi:Transcriptional regulator, ArsR family [Pseudonocardia sp. Ae168_Ps1]|nr:ArsR family transcriptional regulator [Pseudonocardia sp. EC080625-04]ALL77598.1 ArsR family transcriptional regulator [Pseudonocardia sp. EC080610-09]ALL80514.1 ArsR family transcriptional regulator [Pseudonocardia sp. EC080619-01]OLL71399.1 Transcriptional regulator, ArsR family [Pseudonocardia sp. Ae168_Ps1]